MEPEEEIAVAVVEAARVTVADEGLVEGRVREAYAKTVGAPAFVGADGGQFEGGEVEVLVAVEVLARAPDLGAEFGLEPGAPAPAGVGEAREVAADAHVVLDGEVVALVDGEPVAVEREVGEGDVGARREADLEGELRGERPRDRREDCGAGGEDEVEKRARHGGVNGGRWRGRAGAPRKTS